MANWKMVVGLGNPGHEYERTRHNVGFVAVDKLADVLNVSINENKFNGKFGRGEIEGVPFIIAKPQTFMNLSGDFVQAICAFYKISTQNIFVIHDDVSLPPGKIRLRESGSAGGQNGMADIIRKLGTSSLRRARIGVGDGFDPSLRAKHVLSSPTQSEKPLVEAGIANAAAAAHAFLSGKSFPLIMNEFNAI